MNLSERYGAMGQRAWVLGSQLGPTSQKKSILQQTSPPILICFVHMHGQFRSFEVGVATFVDHPVYLLGGRPAGCPCYLCRSASSLKTRVPVWGKYVCTFCSRLLKMWLAALHWCRWKTFVKSSDFYSAVAQASWTFFPL